MNEVETLSEEKAVDEVRGNKRLLRGKVLELKFAGTRSRMATATCFKQASDRKLLVDMLDRCNPGGGFERSEAT